MHKQCKEPGCESLALVKGYCLTHYREHYPELSICANEGCENLVFRRGLCRQCYVEDLEYNKRVQESFDIYKEKQEISELKKQIKYLSKKLNESNKKVEIFDSLKSSKVNSNIVRREKNSNLREATAVALASDWHLYEMVKPEKVHYKNEYNPEIALNRSCKFFNGILNLLEYHRNNFHIRDLILWLGGDIIHGYIHPENVENNYGSPIREILFAYEIFVNGINMILSESCIDRLYIPCNIGNHSRTTEKMRVSTAADNSYEYLLYRILSDYFEKDKRVQFIIAEGEHLYQKVYDFWVRYVHGHRVPYYNGMAGIFGALRKACVGWNTIQPCDITNVAHFHQSHLDSYGMTTNASLVGYNEFAISKNFEYEKPSQTFYLIDSKRGKCMPTRIWVE